MVWNESALTARNDARFRRMRHALTIQTTVMEKETLPCRVVHESAMHSCCGFDNSSVGLSWYLVGSPGYYPFLDGSGRFDKY